MPEVKLAERLGGIVSMAAAVRRRHHGRPHSHFIAWLAHYESDTPGTESGDNSTLQCGPDDDAQADTYLLILPEYGGQCRFTGDDYIEGGPEFVAEISSSSRHRDLKVKLPLYRENGVREYVVWKTDEQEILWFRRERGEFVQVAPDEDGLYRSTVFPGLWLDSAALMGGDLKRMLRVLRKGLRSPEHRELTRRLVESRKQ
jgi:hypothetical protein